MTGKKIFQSVIVLMLLLGAPVAAFADDGPPVTVTTECNSVNFAFELSGGLAPYTVTLKFGDEEVFEAYEQPAGVFDAPHFYPSQGEFEWALKVTDDNDFEEETKGIVIIDGPTATLGSTPDPPQLTIESGTASIEFSAAASGGAGDYTYTWDLNGDGEPDAGLTENTAAFTYTEGGKYKAAVTVTDACGMTDTATLAVVVVDPEDDPDNACHPTAQKIADAVSSIFPDRAAQTYTCEDIFNIFEGALIGSHTGFGRLWHAYQLTQTIPALTWEEIRDWKLDGSSWGAITQLNRFADKLDGYGIRNLFDLVVNGDNTLREILTAARTAVRYEADFSDALLRLSKGAKTGELGQFYKLAAEMGVEPAMLDQYLDDGTSLSELRHAAKMSERTESDWTEIIDAKSSGHSWGEIGQADKLAGDGISAADILAMEGGVQGFRSLQRDEEKLAREAERTAREDARTAREDARTAARKETLGEKTADRLSKQYEFTGDMTALFNDCEGNLGCVRKKLREMDQTQLEGVSDKDTRTAERLFAQYGVKIYTIREIFDGICGGNWNCVRAELREMTSEPHGKNK